ncbi:hypothetical protein EVAR_42732_1 [Eumeta japonica]|uniref:Uncharacterized protein n=1 Tax=Eumeta variegata TaxID=151549 RepID=A0A4C1XKW0_EUMVA|nr:hypothetical protein EVAR_42732_1 [Eumeta japonica]
MKPQMRVVNTHNRESNREQKFDPYRVHDLNLGFIGLSRNSTGFSHSTKNRAVCSLAALTASGCSLTRSQLARLELLIHPQSRRGQRRSRLRGAARPRLSGVKNRLAFPVSQNWLPSPRAPAIRTS